MRLFSKSFTPSLLFSLPLFWINPAHSYDFLSHVYVGGGYGAATTNVEEDGYFVRKTNTDVKQLFIGYNRISKFFGLEVSHHETGVTGNVEDKTGPAKLSWYGLYSKVTIPLALFANEQRFPEDTYNLYLKLGTPFISYFDDSRPKHPQHLRDIGIIGELGFQYKPLKHFGGRLSYMYFNAQNIGYRKKPAYIYEADISVNLTSFSLFYQF